MKTKKRIALVIGSGGIKCAAAIGLWRMLQAENIQVDSLVGCSGGSLYAALIANHTDVNQMQEGSKTLWTSNIMQGYVENLKASKDGTLRFNERSGLVDDSVLNSKLREIYGNWTFSELKLPLKVVATELLTGEKVTISEGSIFDAVRASL